MPDSTVRADLVYTIQGHSIVLEAADSIIFKVGGKGADES
jgi:hypothetical protein